VLLRFEEIEEGLADLGGGHGTMKRDEGRGLFKCQKGEKGRTKAMP
jgi:hypothetical protein